MIPPLRPEPKRDGYGRYLVPNPDGGHPLAMSRATTVVSALKDQTGLMDWKVRKAVVGAIADPRVADRVVALDYQIEKHKDDWKRTRPAKDEARQRLEELMEASGANSGRNRGTEAHSLTEWADAGRLEEVWEFAAEQQKNDLAAYLEAMAEAQIERPVEYIERIVINRAVQSAGTFDRLVRLVDGRLVVADLKSQQSVNFGFMEIACQMAIYANADFMVGDNDELITMPEELDRSLGIVMHAPVGSGRCDLYEVDLEAGWEAAQTAHKVRTLRSASKRMGRLYVAPRQSKEQLSYLITHAQTVEALERLWEHRLPGLWTDGHTSAARIRRAELTAAAMPAAA